MIRRWWFVSLPQCSAQLGVFYSARRRGNASGGRCKCRVINDVAVRTLDTAISAGGDRDENKQRGWNPARAGSHAFSGGELANSVIAYIGDEEVTGMRLDLAESADLIGVSSTAVGSLGCPLFWKRFTEHQCGRAGVGMARDQHHATVPGHMAMNNGDLIRL